MERAARIECVQRGVKTNYLLIRVCAVFVAGHIVTAHVVADVGTLVLFRPSIGTISLAETRTIDIAGHRYGLDLGTCHSCYYLTSMVMV